MRKSAVILALLVCLAAAGRRARAQTSDDGIKTYESSGFWSIFTRSYVPHPMPPVDFSNSNRLDQLMRAGNIYLSLQDAIALALENNLDIAYARYDRPIAESDLLRAKAGQLLRGINTSVRQGQQSASGGGVLAGASSLGAGGSGGAGAQGGVLSGLSVQLAGSTIPNLDPTITAASYFYHRTQPLTSSFVTGTNFLVSEYKGLNWQYQQGFLTGTNLSIGMTNTVIQQNSPTNDFNPSTNADLNLTLTQHLLQGFGLAVNNRAIRVAKNNRVKSDLVFKAQVMATVKNVTDLYWDLVTFDENLKVRQHALELNQKLYQDNKKRMAIGTIAPIDLVQAEAEVASAQQDVTNAETQVLQQEMILKSVLSKSAVDNTSIRDARIIPTNTFQIPQKDAVRPIQDLIAEARANRPEFAENGIDIENAKINLQGTKSALLPSLDLFASVQNNALSGQINTVPYPSGGLVLPPRTPENVNPFFLGGYSKVLTQLFARNFPDYQVGFQLNIPLRNRSAQADMIRAQLDLRQQQIAQRQLENNIRLNVVNARIALQQARAAYETSVKARQLQEQTLAGEQRKYQLGTSSLLNVVIVQRDLVTRQEAELQALNNYIRSRNSLEDVTGSLLKDHNVDIEEAFKGVVNRPPSPPPVLNR